MVVITVYNSRRFIINFLLRNIFKFRKAFNLNMIVLQPWFTQSKLDSKFQSKSVLWFEFCLLRKDARIETFLCGRNTLTMWVIIKSKMQLYHIKVGSLSKMMKKFFWIRKIHPQTSPGKAFLSVPFCSQTVCLGL